ncbi:probable mitochondrial adenine nucleotide transporter BTL3 [Tanacetum coccineum]
MQGFDSETRNSLLNIPDQEKLMSKESQVKLSNYKIGLKAFDCSDGNLEVKISCGGDGAGVVKKKKVGLRLRGWNIWFFIASSQGLRGFWKGNFVNILCTTPFKALNFCAYDSYRKQLLRLTRNEETTNFKILFASVGAGMTANILCLPLEFVEFWK